MKYLLAPIILLALVFTSTTAFADNNSATSTSTQSTDINGHGTETTTTSHDNGPPHIVTHTFTGEHEHGFVPFFHNHVVIIHEPSTSTSHVIIVHRSGGSTVNNQNQNIPIVFVKGVGFVAPINCKLTSAGDKIVCDFEQVQIN